MLSQNAVGQRQDRLLTTLESLLELPTTEVNSILNQAALLVARILAAENTAAFLYDDATNALVALGTRDTPMGRQQHCAGLDHLLLVNGGRRGEGFQRGVPYLTGDGGCDC